MTYYHNITKQMYNFPTMLDLMVHFTIGDTIMISTSGNAMLYPMNKTEYDNIVATLKAATSEDKDKTE